MSKLRKPRPDRFTCLINRFAASTGPLLAPVVWRARIWCASGATSWRAGVVPCRLRCGAPGDRVVERGLGFGWIVGEVDVADLLFRDPAVLDFAVGSPSRNVAQIRS